FGFGIESEHYDLTVQVRPRAGMQHAVRTVGVIGLESGSYDQRVVEGSGRQSITFRLPPGTYSAGSLTSARDRDGASVGVVSYAPTVRLGANTTVVLNERRAKQFTYAVDRPVVSDGEIMMVEWNGAAGTSGFTLAGAFDRLYAMPLQGGKAGTPDSSLKWLLSEPDAVLRPDHGASVGLRALAAP